MKRNLKKFLALMLSVCMLMSMTGTVFAETDGGGQRRI